MIKVTNGNKFWDGKRMYVSGDLVDNLSSDEEDKLVEVGKAEYYEDEESEDEESENPEKKVEHFKAFFQKLIPDGNVETVQRYIAGINDIDVLEKIAIEEETNKNRKTVLDAISKRAQELVTDDNDSDDEALGFHFNPEDVIEDE